MENELQNTEKDRYYVMLKKVINWIKHERENKVWRRLNPHNKTVAKSRFDFSRVSVGKDTYGSLNVFTNDKESRLFIGAYCSIADNVAFLVGNEHRMNCISSFPFKYTYGIESSEALSKGDIIIEDDVWIGHSATILSGIKIGKGAVVGAGAVVTKDVPAYAIVGGIPAVIIKYRFDEKVIHELCSFDLKKLSQEKILANMNLLYTPINSENVKEIIDKLQE